MARGSQSDQPWCSSIEPGLSVDGDWHYRRHTEFKPLCKVCIDLFHYIIMSYGYWEDIKFWPSISPSLYCKKNIFYFSSSLLFVEHTQNNFEHPYRLFSLLRRHIIFHLPFFLPSKPKTNLSAHLFLSLSISLSPSLLCIGNQRKQKRKKEKKREQRRRRKIQAKDNFGCPAAAATARRRGENREEATTHRHPKGKRVLPHIFLVGWPVRSNSDLDDRKLVNFPS